jgi:hypothetical protein
VTSIFWTLKKGSISIPRHAQHGRRATLAEDVHRLRCLERSYPTSPATAALRAAVEGSRNLASAQAVVILRERLGSQLLDLHANLPAGTPTCVATLLPNYGEIVAGNLRSLNFREFNQRLRSQLNRACPGGIEGFLVSVVEGEHIKPADVYRIHHHVFAAGEMVQVLDSLKTIEPYQTRPGVKRPHVVKHIESPDRQLPYLLKSFWSSRYEGPVDGQELNKRSRTKQRIPSSREADLYVKLHDSSASDLILLMGARIKHGRIKQT